MTGERRIIWLSAPLPTRTEAYRCEWALKAYKGRSRNKFPTRYEEVVSLSSVPVVAFSNAKLEFDAATTRAVFALSWELSHDLGPSHIVEPAYYDLERYDTGMKDWIKVDRGVVVGFSGQFGASWVGRWRARAVNAFSIPGPWSYFEVSESDIATGVQQLVELNKVSVDVNENTGAISVQWNIPQPISGLTFEVERAIDGERDLHQVDGNHNSFDDAADTETVIVVQYRVRAVLDEVRGSWVPATPIGVTVGGSLPGAVDILNVRCQHNGSIQLKWACPEWHGFGALAGYEVETSRENAKFFIAANGTVIEWLDEDSIVDEVKEIMYRIRARNEHGAGPWQLVTVSAADRLSGLSDGLAQLQVLHPKSCSVAGVVFAHYPYEDGPKYAVEVERFDVVGSDSEIYKFDSGAMDVPWLGARAMVWRSGVLRRGCFVSLSERSTVIRSDDLASVLGGSISADGLKATKIRYVVSPAMGIMACAVSSHGFGSITPRDLADALSNIGIYLLARVDYRNKGGLSATWGHQKCFIPASRAIGNVDERVAGEPIILDLLEQRGSRDLVCGEVRVSPQAVSGKRPPRSRRRTTATLVYSGTRVRHPGWDGDGIVESVNGDICLVRFEHHPEYGAVRCNTARVRVMA